MKVPPIRFLFALFLVFGLIAAACSDDPDVSVTGNNTSGGGAASDDTGDGAEAFPVTVESNGAEVTIDEEPTSIVSMSPALTEILYAIDAGDQVKAVDALSNYPPEAPVTDLSAYQPNVEAIIELEPDLVILSDDINDTVAGLDAVDIPVLVVPAAASLEDTYAGIEKIGAATGHVGDAAELVGQMQADIEELVAQVPDHEEPPTYYHELDETLYSVTSQTFIGEIYALAGLENVADAADPQGELGGYPQLSAEYLVDANPDFIFLADTKCCKQNLETVSKRAGFSNINAVTAGRVVELDDDIASRWGPRVVDFVRSVVEATADVPIE